MPVPRRSPARLPRRTTQPRRAIQAIRRERTGGHDVEPSAAPPNLFRRLEWLWRDVVLAILVGCLVGLSVFWVQNHFDDEREQRERAVEDARQQQAERLEDERVASTTRLENLRFVRERSSTDPDLPRPFQGLDLSGQILNSLDLQGADFQSADLTRTQMSGINLRKASLALATMNGVQEVAGGADFTGADLHWASLEHGVRMALASFSNANMEGAHLNGARFLQTHFDGADLSRADLRDTRLARSSFRKTDPSFANLAAADLSDSDISGADLRGANLTGVSLEQICRYDIPPRVDPGVRLPRPQDLQPCRRSMGFDTP